MNIKTSVTELVGHTPLIELVNIEKEENIDAKLIGKLEYFNPAGSAKDRIAKEIILSGLDSGEITKDSVLIEPTSGNTGIGLASVGASLGMKVVIVMPSNMSVERIKLMKGYGADVVLTDAAKGMAGAIEKAEEMAKETPGSYIPGQFVTPLNARAHYKTTGPEIWEDTDGTVDIFIASVGTGGTISGTGRYLKEKNPDVKVIAVEPASSPLLSGGQAGPHKIQGIGANFIPDALDRYVYDEVVTVENDEAMECGRQIGKKEGILVGISAGAVLAAGKKVAARAENKGKNIVLLFTDTGERYLSSELFED